MVTMLCFVLSGKLQEEEMDTSPQGIFIIDKPLGNKKTTPVTQRQEENKDECLDNVELDSEEEVDEDDESISASKSANGRQDRRKVEANGDKHGVHVSSDESSDEEEVVEISSKCPPEVSTPCILTESR